MKRAKKTIKVEDLKNRINNGIRRGLTKEIRLTLAIVLADILHETGNYKGFNYIEWVEGGHAQWVNDGKPEDNSPYIGDKSLIEYY